jgi:hypothetical protein
LIYLIRIILISFVLSGCASGQFSVNEGTARFSLPFDWPGQQDEQIITDELSSPEPSSEEPISNSSVSTIKGIYVGMSKTELYKLFSASQLEDYRKQGNQEWITFSAGAEREPTDTVEFYLVGGKVKDYKSR